MNLRAIGTVRSSIVNREDAPKQGNEGAPDVWIEIEPDVADALSGLSIGEEVIVITWFHRSQRDVLRVHPRGDTRLPLTGVFATRSPDRPNPLGLHRVAIKGISGLRILAGPMEAIDGTPVVDIKIVIGNDPSS
ncbi:MAG TPA: tRNA (N6-threonylcarbamoyladenosine(37)-N6)-methyltransferase TrmO [Candidatus Baltobacteraceae bacterium]|jgi:tRNA-Thr(GGU) m(6)t(6)A37 methyltransferase TsaA|nr:tRNA (N6-threonylcarbamoyladenosine(37)-N6)-methyltransferase TrmO [Candidatus Baltobacteraceae bacterium]